MSMILSLSRSYTCRFGAPIIHSVDPEIFTRTYFGACMACTYCHDSCCQYGADVDTLRVAALTERREELERFLNLPFERWFRTDPADLGWIDEPEYPGGSYTRTRVADQRCVFVDNDGRGCRIHSYCLQNGIDVHHFKPLVCLLFPISFNRGVFHPALELQDDSLECLGPGVTCWQSSREDVRWYFGDEMVAELDALERQFVRPVDLERFLPLPLVSSDRRPSA